MLSFVLWSFADWSALLAFVVEPQCSRTFAATGCGTSLLYFSTIVMLSDTGDVYFNHNLHLSWNIPLVSIAAMCSCPLICFITSIFSLEASLNKGVHASDLHISKLFSETKLLLSREQLSCLSTRQTRVYPQLAFCVETMRNHVLIALRYDWIKWRLRNNWSFYAPLIFWNSAAVSGTEVAT